MKEDLFCKQELEAVIKGLQNNETSEANSVVNEFLKYGVYEVRGKLPKISRMTF